MVNIVLTAENFAFGPIGKLLDISPLLLEQKYNLIFAGFGTSLQLAKSFPFNKVYEIDTDNPKSSKDLEKILSQADMLLSSMDIPSVVLAKKLGKLTTWLDCLFWFWDSIPEHVLGVDLFIRERLMDDARNEKEYGSRIKNLCTVGPIIGQMAEVKRKNQVLVSYGGGEAPYWYKAGRDTNYPFMMTELLLKSVDWSQFDRIIVATSERIIKELSERFRDTPFEFMCLPHDQFLKELSRSEIILITPGLVTAELSFQSGTPTIFLPPSNNSQYLQLDQFMERDLAQAAVHLSDFMPKLELEGIPLKESTQLVLRQLQELNQSSNIQLKIGSRIEELVKKRKQWSKTFIDNGRKFIDSLGGNGAQAAADEINKLLASHGLLCVHQMD